MTKDSLKGFFLHAVKEFAQEYERFLHTYADSAKEGLEALTKIFLGDHPILEINDLYDYQYDSAATFYLHLLERLEEIDSIGMEARVAHCGWIRRHGDPSQAVELLSTVLTKMPPGLRSTAEYEIAQAYQRMGKHSDAIQWLMTSTRSAEIAGNHLHSLINQAVAVGWETETDPDWAKERLTDLLRQFINLWESGPSSEREIAERWVVNTTYDLAKIIANTGDGDPLSIFLNYLAIPEYRERKWITEEQLQELRAAL